MPESSTTNAYQGQDLPPDAIDWIRANPDEAQRVLASLAGEGHAPPVPLSELVNLPFPRSLLSAFGKGGALLTPGNILVLSGEGGVSKSTLALSIAIGVAGIPDGKTDAVAQIFNAIGGPVLMVSWEDAPAIVGWRALHLAYNLDNSDSGPAHNALSNVHLLSLQNAALFGPMLELDGRRPVKLEGWDALEAAFSSVKPLLLVIDPVLAAYVGDSNASPAAVREFYGALTEMAGDAGILAATHSNKAARQSTNLADPGQVGGSAAWTDAARGVLTLTRGVDRDSRILTISKSNYGPDRISLKLRLLRSPDGAVVGFEADGGWEDTAVMERLLKGEQPAAATVNGAGGNAGGTAAARRGGLGD